MPICDPDGNGPVEAGPGDGSGGAGPGDLEIRVPDIDTQYGEKLWRQKRAVYVDQETCACLQMAMRDDSGQNIDLTAYGLCNNDEDSPELGSSESSCVPGTGDIKARWREAALVDKSLYQTDPTVVNASQGIVRSGIPPQIVSKTGIYLAQFAVLNEDDCPLFMDDCYVYVVHSAWHDHTLNPQTGPPTIDDVRLSLRDSDPQLNELIDEYDFDLGEIAFAATRVVQFWNDQPPTIAAARFSTKTYPFREIWIEGIHLFLFELIEEYYRRNFFKVSAGGTVTDDKNKYREYNSAWKERYQRFKELVMHQKAQINLNRGWSWLGSGYPYGHQFRS